MSKYIECSKLRRTPLTAERRRIPCCGISVIYYQLSCVKIIDAAVREAGDAGKRCRQERQARQACTSAAFVKSLQSNGYCMQGCLAQLTHFLVSGSGLTMQKTCFEMCTEMTSAMCG